MPKQPTPSNVLELRGAYKKNPQRRRTKEPKSSEPIGKCPDYLTEGQKKCWLELKNQCCPGVLTGADGTILELGACLYAEMRADYVAMSTSRLAQFLKVLGVLGLTPADRTRIKIEPQAPANKFAAFD